MSAMLAVAAAAAIGVTLLARYVSVGLPVALLRRRAGLPHGAWQVLTWGGLRGGISVALALSIPGEAVLGLVGHAFVAGTAALSFLLFAEVVAATATVSESALIYIARKRNMAVSVAMLVIQVLLSIALILLIRRLGYPPIYQATGPAIALLIALGMAAIVKARLLSGLLKAPVSGWRWELLWAAVAGIAVGEIAIRLPEWAELAFGIPAILLAFGAVMWWRGFTAEDRELFRMRKEDIEDLSLPDPSTGGDAPR
jgi:hypothetical protein